MMLQAETTPDRSRPPLFLLGGLVEAMEIVKEHTIDCSERRGDGFYVFYYAFWIFKFCEGDTTFVARSYDDQQEAHFLRKENSGLSTLLTDLDLASPLFAKACDYLRRAEGKGAIAVLTTQGYEDVNSFFEG
jgi:hypothetical protein